MGAHGPTDPLDGRPDPRMHPLAFITIDKNSKPSACSAPLPVHDRAVIRRSRGKQLKTIKFFPGGRSWNAFCLYLLQL
jgi:hypothetical protein